MGIVPSVDINLTFGYCRTKYFSSLMLSGCDKTHFPATVHVTEPNSALCLVILNLNCRMRSYVISTIPVGLCGLYRIHVLDLKLASFPLGMRWNDLKKKEVTIKMYLNFLSQRTSWLSYRRVEYHGKLIQYPLV